MLLDGGTRLGQHFFFPLPRGESLCSQEPEKPSIAVVPFVNISNNPEQEYFSDDVTKDITLSLAKNPNLFVISHHSAFTYKGKAVKVQDVNREMGVRYVLEGGVHKADNQILITTQLFDAATGEHLGAERYDLPIKDIFTLQNEIEQKIIQKTETMLLSLPPRMVTACRQYRRLWVQQQIFDPPHSIWERSVRVNALKVRM